MKWEKKDLGKEKIIKCKKEFFEFSMKTSWYKTKIYKVFLTRSIFHYYNMILETKYTINSRDLFYTVLETWGFSRTGCQHLPHGPPVIMTIQKSK